MFTLLRNTFGLALGNLRRNKLRTGLSLLGIMIGVFAVTIIVSLGFGLKSYILGQVEQFGKNFVTINAQVPGLSHQGSITSQLMSADVVSIDYEDAEALAEIPHVIESVAFDSSQAFVSFRDEEYRALIFGSTANYMVFDLQAELAVGRFFTEREERNMTPVLVLGSKVADKLFGEDDPIGKKVRLKTLQLEVVGVMEPRGAMGPMDFDTIVLMPLKLMQKRLSGDDYVQEIDLIVSETKYIGAVSDDVERILRRRHNITDPDKDDFMIHTYTEIIATIGTVTNAITILLGLLAAISLLVGGIGIMNIMLISVTERIREVGLRKALGAKNSTIWAQFLVESVVLTTVGGGLGGLLATGLTFAIIAYARHTGFDIQYIVSLSSFLGGLTVAMIVGVIFGAWPAKKAAELDVVTALRYE
ncbi:MAG: ABC transporter permease [Patescibacteria group bacterium]|nr:ABC transporter permease [Patescibacteria group bacterium]